MRWATARAAMRRGSSMTSRLPAAQFSPSSASGTTVLLPAPGGAWSTAAPCPLERCAQRRQRRLDRQSGLHQMWTRSAGGR